MNQARKTRKTLNRWRGRFAYRLTLLCLALLLGSTVAYADGMPPGADSSGNNGSGSWPPAGAAPTDHHAVSGHTLGGGGRGGEAQVEVTLLGGELAQRAHGHGVAHASLQRT